MEEGKKMDMAPEKMEMNQPSDKEMAMPMMKKISNTRLFIVGGVSLVVLALIVIVGVDLYRVYATSSTDTFTVGVARALHLPIAKVGATSIPYSEYAFDRRALLRMVQYDLQKGTDTSGVPPLSSQDISNQVLSRLMSNVIIDRLAERYEVTVQQSEIDGLKQEVLSQFKTPSEAEDDLMKRYGWSLATYEERVMRPFLLQNTLNNKLQNDPALKTEIKQTAQGVLDQIKQGASFEDLAKKYSEDASAAQGGDLNWFGKNVMVPEFETVAFKLKKGELAPQLVETQFGFHIVKVDDRRVEKTKDAKGKVVNQEQVRARHILFRLPNLETILAKEIKQTPIVVYGKAENPFKDLK